MDNGILITPEKYEKQGRTESFTTPFKGLSEAYKKFKNDNFGDDDNDRPVIEFIDEFTTVSLNQDEVGRRVVQIAKEVNTHHHTKTCKKCSPNCRFKYPRFPCWKTVLVRPYPPTDFPEEKENNLKYYSEILNIVKVLIDNEKLIQSIMNKYDKENESKEEYIKNRKLRIMELLDIAKVSEESYLNALKYSRAGYSVHLKRDLDEIYINSYNPEWLRAWDGNIDIQPVFDHFAIVTYVTEYYSKDETGTVEVLKQVIESNPEDCTKEKMKKIANTFLSHRQIGEAEAFFKLLPDLLLKNANVKCQWLSLERKDDRFIRMKKAEDHKDNNRNKNLRC